MKIEMRWDLLNALIEKFGYESYLEIGSGDNHCFDKIKCKYKYGVDPKGPATYQMTSDEFFERDRSRYDLVFIDGLHEHKQVIRDMASAGCAHLVRNGTIVVHDTNPPTEITQKIPREAKQWTGDCWKAIVMQRAFGSALFTVDMDWGCSVWRRGKQEPIDLNGELTYKNLDKNRKEWLGLITVEEFKQWLDSMPS